MKTTALVLSCMGILATTVLAADQSMQNDRESLQRPQQDSQNQVQQDQQQFQQDQQQFQRQPRQQPQPYQDQPGSQSRSPQQPLRQDSSTDQPQRPTIDLQKVQQLTGMRGQFRNGVLTLKLTPKISSVCIGGIRLDSPTAVSSQIYFKNVGNTTLVSGDLMLLQNQVNPVIDVALNNRLQVTALHSSYLWDTPRLMFMHINGTGNTEQLASAIGKIFDRIDPGGRQSSPMMNESGTQKYHDSATHDDGSSFKGPMKGHSSQDSDVGSNGSSTDSSSPDKSKAKETGILYPEDSVDSGSSGSMGDVPKDGSSAGGSLNKGSDTGSIGSDNSAGSSESTGGVPKNGTSPEGSNSGSGSPNQNPPSAEPQSGTPHSTNDLSIPKIDYSDQKADVDVDTTVDAGTSSADDGESSRSSDRSFSDQGSDADYDTGDMTSESRSGSDRCADQSSYSDQGSRSESMGCEDKSSACRSSNTSSHNQCGANGGSCPSEQSACPSSESTCSPNEAYTSEATCPEDKTSESRSSQDQSSNDSQRADRGTCPVGEARGFWTSSRLRAQDGNELSPTEIDTAQSNLDRNTLQNILRANPIQERGAMVFTFGKMTSVKGQSLDRTMGIESRVVFAGSHNKAVVSGDLAIYENDLQGALRALRQANINILAIANHLTSESPRILFVHFMGIGQAEDLATGIRNALRTTQSMEETQTPRENR